MFSAGFSAYTGEFLHLSSQDAPNQRMGFLIFLGTHCSVWEDAGKESDLRGDHCQWLQQTDVTGRPLPFPQGQHGRSPGSASSALGTRGESQVQKPS